MSALSGAWGRGEGSVRARDLRGMSPDMGSSCAPRRSFLSARGSGSRSVEDELGTPVRSRITAMLGAFLVFVLGVFLGCAPEDEGATNAPSTTVQRTETPARTAEEGSN